MSRFWARPPCTLFDETRRLLTETDERAGKFVFRQAERDAGPHPHEARMLRLDSAKAMERLAWTPRWDLAGALDAIVAWHKAVRDGADPREVTLGQIARYQQRNEKEAAAR